MAAADLQNPFARLGRKQFHGPADPLIPHRHPMSLVPQAERAG
ncbi:hypothetical protein J2Z31_003688 [Sinorhizobium kostiense]|uniref:Uncharacterized protein n=1 Tax=Sinorhizobium kostiense TaxID=76747 RepID=A0ABS4R2R3_9HYPH|nr:hypothetical protein [Sinorhizobium kostiense]